MTGKKYIEQDTIHWQSQKVSKLNYDTIFSDSDKGNESEAFMAEIESLKKQLAEQERSWQSKLRKMEVSSYERGYLKGKEVGKKEAEDLFEDKLNRLQSLFEKSHEEWKEIWSELEPGILDLIFDISEEILGIPVTSDKMKEIVTQQLNRLLQKMDDEYKASIIISENDTDLLSELIQEYENRLTVRLTTDSELNPGEFKFETKREQVVRDFKKQLKDFKESLNLPTWDS